MEKLKQQNKKYLFLVLIFLSAAIISGCYTPKGGSSIPWNRPADWEGKTMFPGMRN